MEFRRLRYFVVVAEELSFSRAAGRLYLSQPALSQQIRKLEEEVGVDLLHRSNKRRVELTEAGRVLFEGARRALVQVDQSLKAAREVGGATKSRLGIGFPEYVNHTPIGTILNTFRRRRPDVELEEHELLVIQQTLQQIDQLRRGEIDLGFLLLPVEDEALELEHMLRVELLAALPEDHRLADLPEIPMRALRDERLLLFSRRFHPGSYDYIVKCCRDAGFEPDIVMRNEPQLYSGSTTYRMVSSGLGVAVVVPPLNLPSRPSGVVFRPLKDPAPALNLAAAWLKENSSPNLQAFLEVLHEFDLPLEVRAKDSKVLLEGNLSERYETGT